METAATVARKLASGDQLRIGSVGAEPGREGARGKNGDGWNRRGGGCVIGEERRYQV